jgi:signal transduction histidine kinase
VIAAPSTPAVAEERRRIARELHDVVGHSLSLMVIGARTLGGGDDREARLVGDSIASLGREAMAELARTLEQLRPDEYREEPAGSEDRSGSEEPARGPSLAGLPRLVEHARLAGLAAELRVEGSPRPVPAAIDLSGYRIVQKALTNVIRHAGARRANVTVRYRVDAIGLEVVDDGTGPGPRLTVPRSRPAGNVRTHPGRRRLPSRRPPPRRPLVPRSLRATCS